MGLYDFMVEKYGYVKALIFNDLDMKVDFPEKLELSDEYAIFDEKTSTLIGHDEEYWKYKNIEFYLGDETVEFDVENLEKFKNVVQEDIDNLENLVRKMINIVVPKDAKKLQRFAKNKSKIEWNIWKLIRRIGRNIKFPALFLINGFVVLFFNCTLSEVRVTANTEKN